MKHWITGPCNAPPDQLQQIYDSLAPQDIDRVFRKWLKRIPLPLRLQDREAGYDWDLSIWQVEVSLTQIFDRPLRGSEFFEEIIRDNLDLGRPGPGTVNLRSGGDEENAGGISYACECKTGCTPACMSNTRTSI